MSELSRFAFIGHALRGDGPFRPVVNTSSTGASLASDTYLVRYPRESDLKFARRNEMAWHDSPLGEVVSRYVGYLGTKSPQREFPHELYEAMSNDVDSKGSSIGVFWSAFATQARARGSMLLLVDMPPTMAPNLREQIAQRVAPFWQAIAPEAVSDYAIGSDGKFDFVEFPGVYERSTEKGKEAIECTWYFDRVGWSATAKGSKGEVLDADTHGLGECPVLIFTEGGEFPHFGQFAPIADLMKRKFNMDSEFDELLRSQTFSLLTMQVPDNATEANKLEVAKTAGQTIGTNNLLIHTGTAPQYVAPPNGPATVYLDALKRIEARINEIGLDVRGTASQESGVSLQWRFAALNASLALFSERLEDLERRAWSLSAKWLGLSVAPTVSWPRDYSIADIAVELTVLQDMQANDMPQEAVALQKKRIVALQFPGLESADLDRVNQAIDSKTQEIT